MSHVISDHELASRTIVSDAEPQCRLLACRGCGIATSTGICERCWGRGNDPWIHGEFGGGKPVPKKETAA